MKTYKYLIAVEGFLFGIAPFFLRLDYKGGFEQMISQRTYAAYADNYHDSIDPDDDLSIGNQVSVLMEENRDMIGFITVDGTSIDYPVVRDKTDSEGNYYYLSHNFEGMEDMSGCPFVRRSQSLDDSIITIFAHNNSNGTMFADLSLLDDESFYDSNGQIVFDTIEGRRIYEIAAVMDVDISGSDFTFWGWNNFPYVQTELDFIDQINRLSTIKRFELTTGNRYLLLVTCEYTHADGRRIAVAVRTS